MVVAGHSTRGVGSRAPYLWRWAEGRCERVQPAAARDEDRCTRAQATGQHAVGATSRRARPLQHTPAKHGEGPKVGQPQPYMVMWVAGVPRACGILLHPHARALSIAMYLDPCHDQQGRRVDDESCADVLLPASPHAIHQARAWMHAGARPRAIGPETMCGKRWAWQGQADTRAALPAHHDHGSWRGMWRGCGHQHTACTVHHGRVCSGSSAARAGLAAVLAGRAGQGRHLCSDLRGHGGQMRHSTTASPTTPRLSMCCS